MCESVCVRRSECVQRTAPKCAAAHATLVQERERNNQPSSLTIVSLHASAGGHILDAV